jgi:hypothetical protein
MFLYTSSPDALYIVLFCKTTLTLSQPKFIGKQFFFGLMLLMSVHWLIITHNTVDCAVTLYVLYIV